MSKYITESFWDFIKNKKAKKAEYENPYLQYANRKPGEDVNIIRDLFLEYADKYDMVEDENGKLVDYLDHGNVLYTSKDRIEMGLDKIKIGPKPQYFVEYHGHGLFSFTIISANISILTDELQSDIDSFKETLSNFGFLCKETELNKRMWAGDIDYINFYIHKKNIKDIS